MLLIFLFPFSYVQEAKGRERELVEHAMEALRPYITENARLVPLNNSRFFRS
jgi:hypothetical protein